MGDPQVTLYWNRVGRKASVLGLGLVDSWAAPVAKITADSGFGDGAWTDNVPSTLIAARMSGGPIVKARGDRDGESTATGGGLFLVPKGGDIGYVAPAATVFCHIYLSDGLLARVDDFTGVAIHAERLRHDIVFSRDPGLKEHTHAYIRRALDNRQRASALEMEGRMLLLLDAVAGLHGARRLSMPVKGGLTVTQMRRVSDYVHEHIDQDIHLDELASVAGLGPTHFGRAFRQTTGSSPYRWVLQERLARAQLLLASRHLPLVEVALSCGFADQSHFTSTFRRYLGTTPGAFRRDMLA